MNAQVFTALGDPTRIEIVRRLGEKGPQRTVPLLAGLGMSRQAASKHLRILEEAEIVTSTTHGRTVVRALNTDAIASAGDWLTQRAKAWDDKLEALRRFVEG